MAISAISLFGVQLYRHLIDIGAFTGPAGAFISPLSIYLALCLSLNGATFRSTTHQQLWEPLAQSRFTNEAVLNNRTSQIMRSLIKHANSPGSELLLANAVFSNATFVEADYRLKMLRFYRAPTVYVTSPKAINKWAANVTQGLITKAVPDDLKFKLVLANGVYFLGSWEYPFNKTDTTEQDFTGPTGKKVKVNMMYFNFAAVVNKARVVQVLNSTAFTGVKLPYRETTISAIALLPQDASQLNIDNALKDLNIAEVLGSKHWLDKPSGLQLSLPRFKIKVGQLSLKEALMDKMGIVEAFSDRAQFGRMTNESVMIEDVLHSSVVHVNEEGTEAAAVTTVIIGPTAMPDRLIFNRPFIFMVVDEMTSTLLFLGTVKQPSLDD